MVTGLMMALLRGWLCPPPPVMHPRVAYRRLVSDAVEAVAPLYLLTDADRKKEAGKWLRGR